MAFVPASCDAGDYIITVDGTVDSKGGTGATNRRFADFARNQLKTKDDQLEKLANILRNGSGDDEHLIKTLLSASPDEASQLLEEALALLESNAVNEANGGGGGGGGGNGGGGDGSGSVGGDGGKGDDSGGKGGKGKKGSKKGARKSSHGAHGKGDASGGKGGKGSHGAHGKTGSKGSHGAHGGKGSKGSHGGDGGSGGGGGDGGGGGGGDGDNGDGLNGDAAATSFGDADSGASIRDAAAAAAAARKFALNKIGTALEALPSEFAGKLLMHCTHEFGEDVLEDGDLSDRFLMTVAGENPLLSDRFGDVLHVDPSRRGRVQVESGCDP
jgi:hypothetical protein